MKSKLASFLLAVNMFFFYFATGPLPLNAKAASYENAWFPAPVMNLSQLAYESASHGRCNAIDILPGGNVFAPFTGKIVYKDARWGYVLFQSLDKVYFADGSLDYMSVGFMHDSDISNLYIGQEIRQGTAFYQAGGMGEGNPTAYGVHVDISIFRGKVNSVSGYGNGDTFAYDAFYINTSKTTSIVNKGVSRNPMTNGAPSNWRNLWRETSGNNQPNVEPTIQTQYTPKKTISDGTYYIYSMLASNKCLDIDVASSNAQIWKCEEYENQKFKITYRNNGYYTIESVKTGKMLDVKEGGANTGTDVWTYEYNGSDAQLWAILESPNGGYNIISKANTLLLDVSGAKTENGTNVQVWNQNGNKAQDWKFVNAESTVRTQYTPKKTISDGTYYIYSMLASDKCLDIDVASSNAQIWKCEEYENQKFKITYRNNGYYTIESVKTGKMLDVKEGGANTGTDVWTYEYNGSDAQLWAILESPNGGYNIISKTNTLLLDVSGAKTENGTNVQVWNQNRNKAQDWKFVNAESTVRTQYTPKKTISDGTYYIYSMLAPEKCLDIDGASNNAQIWECKSYDNQQFKIKYQNNGYYTIECVRSGKMLDVKEGGANTGADVWTYEYNGTDAQLWAILESPNGGYNIISKTNTLLLDVSSAKTENGTNVQVWNQNGNKAQDWKFSFVSSDIKLDKTSLSLKKGEAYTLKMKNGSSPVNNLEISWTSSKPGVATVKDGVVTGVNAGTAEITGTAYGKSLVCVVTVTAQGEQIPSTPTPSSASNVHFTKENIYYQDQFNDVAANQWFTDSVASAYEYGLMKGNSNNTFNPYGHVTMAEAITMAARIHSIYSTGTEDFVQSGAWYQVYLDYAYENDIISRAVFNSDVKQKANRAHFAQIFARALPEAGLSAINKVEDSSIPDVKSTDDFSEAVYKLYRAGILTGSDINGTFSPYSYITRAEAAAIVSRMAESNNRCSFTLEKR